MTSIVRNADDPDDISSGLTSEHEIDPVFSHIPSHTQEGYMLIHCGLVTPYAT